MLEQCGHIEMRHGKWGQSWSLEGKEHGKNISILSVCANRIFKDDQLIRVGSM